VLDAGGQAVGGVSQSTRRSGGARAFSPALGPKNRAGTWAGAQGPRPEPGSGRMPRGDRADPCTIWEGEGGRLERREGGFLRWLVSG